MLCTPYASIHDGRAWATSCTPCYRCPDYAPFDVRYRRKRKFVETRLPLADHRPAKRMRYNTWRGVGSAVLADETNGLEDHQPEPSTPNLDDIHAQSMTDQRTTQPESTASSFAETEKMSSQPRALRFSEKVMSWDGENHPTLKHLKDASETPSERLNKNGENKSSALDQWLANLDSDEYDPLQGTQARVDDPDATLVEEPIVTDSGTQTADTINPCKRDPDYARDEELDRLRKKVKTMEERETRVIEREKKFYEFTRNMLDQGAVDEKGLAIHNELFAEFVHGFTGKIQALENKTTSLDRGMRKLARDNNLNIENNRGIQTGEDLTTAQQEKVARRERRVSISHFFMS